MYVNTVHKYDNLQQIKLKRLLRNWSIMKVSM